MYVCPNCGKTDDLVFGQTNKHIDLSKIGLSLTEDDSLFTGPITSKIIGAECKCGWSGSFKEFHEGNSRRNP